jgi:hypothetical protein
MLSNVKREEFAKLGGESRARSLTGAQRSAIARLGAQASNKAQKKALGAKAWRRELERRSRLGNDANRRRVARLLREDPEALRAEMARRGRLRGSAIGDGPKQGRKKAKKARRLKDGRE